VKIETEESDIRNPRTSNDTRLTHAQLLQVMELIHGTDSVELKLTVQAREHRPRSPRSPSIPSKPSRGRYFFSTLPISR
jgi:hypothetical protein